MHNLHRTQVTSSVHVLLSFLLQPRADLDPIYYCELLRACPVKDDGDAHILSFIVKPNVVKYGKYENQFIFVFGTIYSM